MNYQQKPITILGGMGPQASVHLYQLLVRRSQDHPRSLRGVFPHIILRSLALEDFISDQAKQADAKAVIVTAAQRAASDGSCAVAIACNTAHVFAENIMNVTDVRFVSMIELVAEKATDASNRVGLLASPTTVRTKLYHDAITRRGAQCIEPTRAEQVELEGIIRAVIAETAGEKERTKLLRIAKRMHRDGAESIILGCTELPLIFPKSKANFTVHDSLEILTDRLIEKYYE